MKSAILNFPSPVTLNTVLILISLFTDFSLARASVGSEYEGLIQEINQEIRKVEILISCPGIELTKTCGNGVCEVERGETVENCPFDCSSSPIKSYNSQTLCDQVARVMQPSTPEEVRDAVKTALRDHLKVKVVGTLHTTNSLICTDGMTISTQGLKRIHGFESFQGEETVRVEAGVTLGELTEWLHERGRSLGFSLIGYRGASIGGLIANGAHGDSVKYPTLISSLVRSMSLVTSSGEIEQFSTQTTPAESFAALRASLGMLGIAVEFRLKTAPQFNIHLKNSILSDQHLLEPNGALNELESCDYAKINWFPSARKIEKICGNITVENAEAGARNATLDIQVPEVFVSPARVVLQYSSCHKKLSHLLEKLRPLSIALFPPYRKENQKGKLVSTNEVTGLSQRMLSSDLSKMNYNIQTIDWEFAVPISKADEVLKAIRQHLESTSTYLPFSGISIRFSPIEDTTLIAHSAIGGEFKKGDIALFIEWVAYEPFGFPKALKEAYDLPHNDLAKMLIQQFGGRAHWGKNRDLVFPIQSGQPNFSSILEKFRRIILEFDPAGIFANAFSFKAGLRQ